MSNDVFANGRELACKAGSGKSIACFPDVCMTPPENPATPPGVPVPYPNTGMASDTTDGSTTVKISGKEVMLKNKSYFKKSSGDEAGAAAKKGVVSSVNRGKVYFTAWSMDVKVEGENTVRHLDMTTHNHGSPTNTGPWPFLDEISAVLKNKDHPCHTEVKAQQQACNKHRGRKTKECADKACREAKACALVPKDKDAEMCCPPNNTGHHLIEDHWIRGDDKELLPDFAHLAQKEGRFFKKPGGPYDGAPCTCANHDRFRGKHGAAHGVQGVLEDQMIGKPFSFPAGKRIAIKGFRAANPTAKCSDRCLSAQLDAFYGPNVRGKKLRTPTQAQPLKPTQRARAERYLTNMNSW